MKSVDLQVVDTTETIDAGVDTPSPQKITSKSHAASVATKSALVCGRLSTSFITATCITVVLLLVLDVYTHYVEEYNVIEKQYNFNKFDFDQVCKDKEVLSAAMQEACNNISRFIIWPLQYHVLKTALCTTIGHFDPRQIIMYALEHPLVCGFYSVAFALVYKLQPFGNLGFVILERSLRLANKAKQS